MVSHASGNPNAGATVLNEAQKNAEYTAYWQQYWAQCAAWNQYSQQQQQQQQQQMQYEQQQQPVQAPVPQEKKAAKVPYVPGESRYLFEGDEYELVGTKLQEMRIR